ncbi:MAG TPA: lectin-like protein [Kofleriaceae bacterium]|nr:lectin-like protein [Kofleriaceae bacterium]
MKLAVVLAVFAGCGVEIGGKALPVDAGGDARAPVDAPIDAASVRPCTGGDANMKIGNECLVLFTQTKRSWADASTACTNMQAQLAVLDTQAKHTAAKTLAATNDVWIGLTDAAVERTFRWVDATPYVFSAWSVDEPNNGQGAHEEDCAIIAGASARDWDDRPCSAAIANVPANCCTYAYMCQF